MKEVWFGYAADFKEMRWFNCAISASKDECYNSCKQKPDLPCICLNMMGDMEENRKALAIFMMNNGLTPEEAAEGSLAVLKDTACRLRARLADRK